MKICTEIMFDFKNAVFLNSSYLVEYALKQKKREIPQKLKVCVCPVLHNYPNHCTIIYAEHIRIHINISSTTHRTIRTFE